MSKSVEFVSAVLVMSIVVTAPCLAQSPSSGSAAGTAGSPLSGSSPGVLGSASVSPNSADQLSGNNRAQGVESSQTNTQVQHGANTTSGGAK